MATKLFHAAYGYELWTLVKTGKLSTSHTGNGCIHHKVLNIRSAKEGSRSIQLVNVLMSQTNTVLWIAYKTSTDARGNYKWACIPIIIDMEDLEHLHNTVTLLGQSYVEFMKTACFRDECKKVVYCMTLRRTDNSRFTS